MSHSLNFAGRCSADGPHAPSGLSCSGGSLKLIVVAEVRSKVCGPWRRLDVDHEVGQNPLATSALTDIHIAL